MPNTRASSDAAAASNKVIEERNFKSSGEPNISDSDRPWLSREHLINAQRVPWWRFGLLGDLVC
jgi:hypothetical protein